MTLVYPLSDIIASSGNAIDSTTAVAAHSGDTIVIGTGRQVISTTDSGIQLSVAKIDVIVQGTLAGQTTGLENFGLFGGSQDTNVTVSSTGMIIGATGSAIKAGQTSSIAQFTTKITNNGIIVGGDDNSAVESIGTLNFSLTNTGTIENSGDGAAVLSNGSMEIRNYGFISATNIFQDATIAVLDGVVSFSASHISRLDNAGTISSSGIAYAGKANFDFVTNSGIINGEVQLGGGNDTYTGVGSGVVHGTVSGGDGNDILIGSAANDSFYGGAGADVLDGGDGIDTIIFAESSAVEINLSTGIAIGGEADGDTIVHIENISGTGQGDRLTGDANANRLEGLGGNDNLSGMAGNDFLFGFEGNDKITGGAGLDRMYGGAGKDTFVLGNGYDLNIVYDFDVANDIVLLEGLKVSDITVSVYNAHDLELSLATGERLVLRNVSIGQYSSMTINEGVGKDGYLFEGGISNDVLKGTNGNDLIRGNGASDKYYGNGGNDIFEFQAMSGTDVVYDYVDGRDKILFQGGSFADLTITDYAGKDANIVSSSGGRMVIRALDFHELTADDFIFQTPDLFA